ncbi:MAG: winged helix-turn-helix domain-containing protein [Candidatus Acidiferrales bacterium]
MLSDTFDNLLRRAAAFSPSLDGGGTDATNGSGRDEFGTIGETAGAVWHMLSDGGPTALASLIDAAGVPESLFFMAIGWLARENKITIEPCHGDYEIRLR